MSASKTEVGSPIAERWELGIPSPFFGLREDKLARDVVIEQPTSVPDLRGGGSWRTRR